MSIGVRNVKNLLHYREVRVSEHTDNEGESGAATLGGRDARVAERGANAFPGDAAERRENANLGSPFHRYIPGPVLIEGVETWEYAGRQIVRPVT